jgi:hypothetical protein
MLYAFRSSGWDQVTACLALELVRVVSAARTVHGGLTARTPVYGPRTPSTQRFTGQDQCVHFAVLQPDDRNGSVGINPVAIFLAMLLLLLGCGHSMLMPMTSLTSLVSAA